MGVGVCVRVSERLRMGWGVDLAGKYNIVLMSSLVPAVTWLCLVNLSTSRLMCILPRGQRCPKSVTENPLPLHQGQKITLFIVFTIVIGGTFGGPCVPTDWRPSRAWKHMPVLTCANTSGNLPKDFINMKEKR